jgi:hypothetical protein
MEESTDGESSEEDEETEEEEEEEEEEGDVVEERMIGLVEEVKQGWKCKKCGGTMKVSKVVANCTGCGNFFHNKCTEASRVQIEGEVRRGLWRCAGCEKELEQRMAVRDEVEVERVVQPQGGRKEQWKEGKRKELRVLQWNADGIGNKKAELEELLERMDVDVAVVQESKLDGKNKTPVFKGYTTVRKDREFLRGGDERRGAVDVCQKECGVQEAGWLEGEDYGGARGGSGCQQEGEVGHHQRVQAPHPANCGGR